ncbi:MAG TPA: hypothetical protein VFZ66_25920 [Herpetosiphonaceae bacterium]
MTQQQFRWLLLALASGLLAFVIVRRRQQLAAALPQPIIDQAERFVIPWSALERSKPGAAADADRGGQDEAVDEQGGEEEHDEGGVMRRKVSSTHRISFGGKRYGPLPEHLVGEYVEVETRDGNLFVLHQGTPIANFELQD